MPCLTVTSPVGPLTIWQQDDVIYRLSFTDEQGRDDTPLLREAARQLQAYFDDQLEVFDLPLVPDGTDFQKRVYQAMLDIPYGTTRTYGDLAKDLGSVARAVGGACGSNPIPVIIPCHRVLGGGGKTGGFSGGEGVPTKLQLLQLESRRLVLTSPT
ncbi:methylated-DNA--[protein]-cysteine S-methyltransferase [Rhodovibrionaceae bacterium A322]